MMDTIGDAEQLEQGQQWKRAFRREPRAHRIDHGRVLEIEVVALVDLREHATAIGFA